MYTLLSTNSLWPLIHGSNVQAYYGAMSATPLVMNASPTVNQSSNQPIFYYLQPALYAPVSSSVPSRPRLPSDDVFVPEGFAGEPQVFSYLITTPDAQTFNLCSTNLALSKKGLSNLNECLSKERAFSQSSSGSSSPDVTIDTNKSSLESSTKHTNIGQTLDSLSMSNNSNTSSQDSDKNDDSLIHTLFPASLCIALNEDPPEPATVATPLKTSSPIRNESDDKPTLIDFTNLRKRRGREITSSSSEKCPRFSENGVCAELDQCDQILIRSREHNAEEEAAKRREEFLLILEAERERQRKLVLPKHTPKISCKFCRNNGESPEVYTKHRLHYNEKTVCPLLRHYVCPLCNSTGDFAHTIRHCPFNNKKDKIAWKATFLV